MKLKSSTVIIIFVIILAIFAIVVAYLLGNKERSRNYFDEWESESGEVVGVKYFDYVCFNDFQVNLSKYENAKILVVYGSRIYLHDGEDKNSDIIVSVNLEGKDYQVHYKLEREITSKYIKSSYYKGKIFLEDETYIIEYNLSDATTKEYKPEDFIFESKYSYSRIDSETLIITNTETNEEKTITFEDMAISNEYANKLYQMKDEQIWDKKSPVNNIFSKIELIDDKPYIICEVFDRWGQSNATVFEYDFENDNYKYVFSVKVGDRVEAKFRLIRYFSDK